MSAKTTHPVERKAFINIVINQNLCFFFNFDPGMALANTLAVNVHTRAEKRSQGNDLWCKQIFHHDSW